MLTHFAKLVLVIAVISLPSCATANKPSKQPARTAVQWGQKDFTKYNALVRLHDAVTGEFFCSGVVIGKYLVATAAHCLEGRDAGKPNIEVRSMTGAATMVYAVASSQGGDLRADQGVLVGDFTDFNSMHAVTDFESNIYGFEHGKNLVTCGYPIGAKLMCTPFEYRSFYNFHFIGKGMVWGGMSGGAVMDLDTGNVLGTTFAAADTDILVNTLGGFYEVMRIPEKLQAE